MSAEPARSWTIRLASGELPEEPVGAITHVDAKTVRVLKRDGSDLEIRKSELDPAERAAEVVPYSSPSAPPAVSKHDARTQLREPDGRWRASRFRRADTQPKLGGNFFT